MQGVKLKEILYPAVKCQIKFCEFEYSLIKILFELFYNSFYALKFVVFNCQTKS